MPIKTEDNELSSYINWGSLTEQIYDGANNIQASSSIVNQSSFDLDSVYFLMNNEHDFLHKFHQPGKAF